MKRYSIPALALGLLLPAAALAGTSVGMTLSNGPATIRVSFHDEPPVVYVPDQRVYVLNDERCADDVFRYHGAWWAFREGRWYRARTWRGPFAWVEERQVPQPILLVPAARWKHHPHGMPPGLAKKEDVRFVNDRPGVVVVKEKHGRGHGREH